MEDATNQGGVTINISGGNVQILPKATQAIQIINEPAKDEEQADKEACLKRYVEDPERLQEYLQQIRLCESATDLAEVIVYMYSREDKISRQEISKERFIKKLLQLAENVKKGRSVNNVRARIDDELERQKGINKQKSLIIPKDQ